MSEFRLGRSEYWFDPTASQAVIHVDKAMQAKTEEVSPNEQDRSIPDHAGSVCQVKEKKTPKRRRRTRGFTADELDVLGYYENLVVSGVTYLDTQEEYIDLRGEVIKENRPLLNHMVLVYLGLEGLDPFRKDTKKELGRVWGFYQLNRKFHDSIDLIARRLQISPEITNKGKLAPKQKFKIYTTALLFCFSGKTLEEGGSLTS
jgi:hypothetical protein